MKKTVLLVQFEDKEEIMKIRKALMPLGIRIRTAGKEEYLQTIACLMGGKEAERKEEIYEGPGLEDKMMVLGGFTGSGIDQVLGAMRKQGVSRIQHKAVMTETNQSWNCLELFQELERERKQFEQRNQAAES